MKTKILSIFLILLVLCSVCITASAIEMYAPDGRAASVHAADVDAWKSVGWYDYPVTTVYAMDGRSAVISTAAVNDWVSVGWRTTNYITMYAADGRTANVTLGDVAAWKNVGWYEYPVTVMYAFDGRTAVVALSDVTAWENVGWFASKANIYRHVADRVIGRDWGYNARNVQYSCVDMGEYYLLISWILYTNGEKWDKVYKNGNTEFLFNGSDYTDFPFADYIYANYDLPVYWY